MKLTSRQIAYILTELAQREKGEVLVSHFLDYLTEKRLTFLLERVPQHLRFLAERDKELNHSYVETRFPLSEEEKERITTLFRKIDFLGDEEGVDYHHTPPEEIIGGMRLGGRGEYVDASLRRQLRALKKHIQS